MKNKNTDNEPTSYDKSDVDYVLEDLHQNLMLAEHQAGGAIEAATFVNQDQGTNYDISALKAVLKAIKKARELT